MLEDYKLVFKRNLNFIENILKYFKLNIFYKIKILSIILVLNIISDTFKIFNKKRANNGMWGYKACTRRCLY